MKNEFEERSSNGPPQTWKEQEDLHTRQENFILRWDLINALNPTSPIVRIVLIFVIGIIICIYKFGTIIKTIKETIVSIFTPDALVVLVPIFAILIGIVVISIALWKLSSR